MLVGYQFPSTVLSQANCLQVVAFSHVIFCKKAAKLFLMHPSPVLYNPLFSNLSTLRLPCSSITLSTWWFGLFRSVFLCWNILLTAPWRHMLQRWSHGCFSHTWTLYDVCNILKHHLHLMSPFNMCWILETPGNKWHRFYIFTHIYRDRRTEGRTDGQTDWVSMQLRLTRQPLQARKPHPEPPSKTSNLDS